MSPTPVKEKSSDIIDSYSIIAKNFLVLPGIARDLSAIVSGVIGIVKQKGGEVKEGPDESFIAEKDFQAAEKLKKPTQIVEESKKKKEKGGIGSFVSDLLSPKKLIANLMKFAKKMFSPKNLMKVLGKIALPALIISTLWVGISSGFEKWKETGSIWEAYKEAVGSIVEFITLGLIDKETVKNLYQGAADFLMPVIKPIQEFFGKFSDWIIGKWEGVKTLFGFDVKPKKEAKETPQKEEVVTPEITKGKKPEKDKDAQQQAAEELSKPVQLPGEPPPTKAEVQPAAPTPAAPPATAPAPAAKAPTTADVKPKTLSSSTGKTTMIKAMDSAKIDDPTARASIMAQVAHESGGFTTLSENLNYKAGTLLKLFPKKFSGPDDAQQVSSGGPKSVAERIYGGRMGNAPEGSGDGFKYRGRGFIQLTGKNNYTKFGVASDPDSLSKPDEAADSAVKYMLGYKGNWGDIESVSKFVNGGKIGLAERAKLFEGFKNDPDVTKVASIQTTPSGGSVASASNSVAAGQREQQKPTTPVIINKPTTNNTNVNTTQLASAPKDKTTGSNMVLARAA